MCLSLDGAKVFKLDALEDQKKENVNTLSEVRLRTTNLFNYDITNFERIYILKKYEDFCATQNSELQIKRGRKSMSYNYKSNTNSPRQNRKKETFYRLPQQT